MSAGLFGLLDDVATLARLAAASVDDVGAAAGRASVKAAGVVVDDTAVTPQYVRGVAAEREVPIVRRIARGSLRNKLLFILPAALLLSELLPVVITPLLMAGATYLCFEGFEKVWGALRGHGDAHGGDHGQQGEPEQARGESPEQDGGETQAMPSGMESEDTVVAGAVRTDFILSAEIMVIALNEVSGEPLVARALILLVVAVAITLLVYGVVALIVKMDDFGLLLAQRRSALSQRVGRGLVHAMPGLLRLISVVGVAAMLWVGGHILLVGTDELGWHPPYDLVHHLEHAVHDGAEAAGDALAATAGWVVNTVSSAIVGLLWGSVTVLVFHLATSRRRHRSPAAH